MKDIKKLEDRLRNLEYYTALSLLELNTANIFVPDSDGINRYKSGFFVDNFSTFGSQDTTNKINNMLSLKLALASIGSENGENKSVLLSIGIGLIILATMGQIEKNLQL